MPSGHPSIPTSLAWDVDRIRQQLLQGVVVPPQLFNRAIKKLESQLEAKKTVFFSYRGEIIEKRNVEDNSIQQGAADRILSMGDVFSRSKEQMVKPPTVILEVDAKTGVTRIKIGSELELTSNGHGSQPALEMGDPSIDKEAPEQLALPEGVVDEEVETIKVRTGPTGSLLLPEARDLLFGDGNESS